jgi:hypothetical protein
MNQRENDAWTSYESRKHPPHPIVPEPSTYGAIFLALCLIFLAILRFKDTSQPPNAKPADKSP